MAENRVTHALCIGVNLPDLPQVLALADEHANIYASVGVHPDYEDTPEPSVEQLIALAARPKVVAIGETGLDYYRAHRRSGVAAPALSHAYPRGARPAASRW